MDENLKALVKSLVGFGSDKMEDVGIIGFIFVLTVALACSIFVAYLYKYFYSSRSSGSQIHRAFPLLGISITAIFITIQFSLPLSLGLLGALSIVRFRTPIKEPEEIGFLMLVISTSLSCATFNFLFVGILLLVAVIALLLINSGALYQPQDEGIILITLPLDQHASDYSKILAYLDENVTHGKVESISKTDNESVISYTFRGLRNNLLTELQTGLDDLIDNSKYELFLNQHRVF